MIWFNLKELERRIVNDELTDRDAFYYVLGHAIVLAVSFGGDSNIQSGWQLWLLRFLMVLVTVWGMNKAYKANSEGDGRDFLKRYFAISWVVGVRIFAVVMLFAFIVGSIAGILFIMDGGKNLIEPSQGIWITLTSTLVIGIVSYVMIINSLRNLKTVVSDKE